MTLKPREAEYIILIFFFSKKMRENMISGKIVSLFPLLLLLLLAAACQTDYRTEAAERARSYALDRTLDLPESDRNYIRYNDPILMSNQIFAFRPPRFTPIGAGPNRYDSWVPERNNNYDFMHSAFVWHLPKSGFSVVVDGAGERTQRGWTPTQMVYKKFVPENTAFSAAKIKAAVFLANFFPELEVADINQVRFSEPRVAVTAFQHPGEVSANRDTQVKKWMEYIREGKSSKSSGVQISLIWTSPLSGKQIVVSGEAPKKNLFSWKPVKAHLLDRKELEEAILDETVSLKDPQNEVGETIVTPRETTEQLTDKSSFHIMQPRPR